MVPGAAGRLALRPLVVGALRRALLLLAGLLQRLELLAAVLERLEAAAVDDARVLPERLPDAGVALVDDDGVAVAVVDGAAGGLLRRAAQEAGQLPEQRGGADFSLEGELRVLGAEERLDRDFDVPAARHGARAYRGGQPQRPDAPDLLRGVEALTELAAEHRGRP